MITAERLREVLIYSPETGEFRWRVQTSNAAKLDKPAGSLNKIIGYRQVSVDGRRYLAHRLAFLWITGRWPTELIDHRNGNRDDNSWNNIREANRSQNRVNSSKVRADSTIGFKGVYKNHKRWAAKIRLNGAQHYLGTFDTKEEAHTVYMAAALQAHGEFFPSIAE
jgi:hypothetical protein